MQKRDSRPLVWIFGNDPDLSEILAYFATEEGYDALSISTLEEACVALEKVEMDVERAPANVIRFGELAEETIEWLLQVRRTVISATILCVSNKPDGEVARRLTGAGIATAPRPSTLSDVLRLLFPA
ncbi:MAG: hypothetical protein HYW49_02390 [Deltaproteobacteria bacterium]|nr:hypothetical protein [Deltaproteobacteria bacterium]